VGSQKAVQLLDHASRQVDTLCSMEHRWLTNINIVIANVAGTTLSFRYQMTSSRIFLGGKGYDLCWSWD